LDPGDLDALSHPTRSPAPDADTTLAHLRALHRCTSASDELQRLLGCPIAAVTESRARGSADLDGLVGRLLRTQPGEPIFGRTVRLVPLTDHGPGTRAVAASTLWLAHSRQPTTVTRYLHATTLTLGQILRLTGLPATTTCLEWSLDMLDNSRAQGLRWQSNVPVLHRQMLTAVHDQHIAVTEEILAPNLRIGTRGRSRHRTRRPPSASRPAAGHVLPADLGGGPR